MNAGSRPQPRFAVGLFLIAIAGVALYYAEQIGTTGLGGNSDPGPRAFPIALSLLLLLGGVYELVIFAVHTLRRGPASPVDEQFAPLQSPHARRGIVMATITIVVLGIYIAVLPRFGFTLCSLLLAALLMRLLGTRTWLAVLMSLVLVVGVKLMFAKMFSVQLPEGYLEDLLLQIGL